MQKHVAISIYQHKTTLGLWIVAFVGLLLCGLVAAASIQQHKTSAAEDSVYINEFMPSSNAVNDADGEWIEIYNPTSKTVNLHGWSIQDSIGRSWEISDLKIRPSTTIVLCRNGDISQNGGVACDGQWSSLILRNSSGSVSLTNNQDAVISEVNYLGSQVVAGKSIINDDGELRIESTRTYGDGDYGTPGNRTQIRVTTLLDQNRNGMPDWKQGEPRMPNLTMRIYNNEWEPLDIGNNGTNETLTTDKTYRHSGMFIVSAGDFIVCSVSIEGNYQSFARTILSFVSYPEINTVSNQSLAEDENETCIEVEMEENQIRSLVFGQALQD